MAPILQAALSHWNPAAKGAIAIKADYRLS